MRFFPTRYRTFSWQLSILGSIASLLGNASPGWSQDKAGSARTQGGKVQATPASATRNVQQADTGPAVVATVNGQPISLAELAQHCIARHGEELLENMVNRTLLLQACQARNIEITKKDVDDEIARTASKFGLSVPAFLKLLQDERNITPEFYATDIVWHMLSLRALSKDTIKVSPQEIDLAFQREFGPKVQVRMQGSPKTDATARTSRCEPGIVQDAGSRSQRGSRERKCGRLAPSDPKEYGGRRD